MLTPYLEKVRTLTSKLKDKIWKKSPGEKIKEEVDRAFQRTIYKLAEMISISEGKEKESTPLQMPLNSKSSITDSDTPEDSPRNLPRP